MRDNVVLHVSEICESKRSYVIEVPVVDINRPCGVVVFALFYFLLGSCCGECCCVLSYLYVCLCCVFYV